MNVRRATLLLLLGLAACQAPAASSPIPSAESPSSAAASQPVALGGKIVFGRYFPSTDQQAIFTIQPDGSDEREIVLPGSNGGARWSPDGTKLMAYADNAQGLLFMGIANADGSGWTILDSPDPTLNLGCSAWAPDGSRLACEGWDDSDPSRTGIYTVRSSDGGDLLRLSTAPAGHHDIPSDYSPDGVRLLFARDNLDAVTPGQTMTVNIDGTGVRELPVHYASVRWMRDGTGILATKVGVIYLLDPSGENPAQVPGTGGYVSMAAWSPDGSWIVFSSSPRDGTPPDLFIMNRDGSGLTQLTSTPDDYDEGADWAP